MKTKTTTINRTIEDQIEQPDTDQPTRSPSSPTPNLIPSSGIHETHGKQGLDVFLLGVLLRLALLRLPSGPFATFGELHHTGLGGVDVSFVGLFEEAVELRVG
jgi:hypothetical protein